MLQKRNTLDAASRHVVKLQRSKTPRILTLSGFSDNLAIFMGRSQSLALTLRLGLSNRNAKHIHELKRTMMHASLLAELGSWVTVNASNLVLGESDQPMLIGTHYWVASQKRAERWVAALKMFERDFKDPQVRHDPWPALEIVVQEILLSELLTRVWSAVVTTHDQHHDSDELFGFAHSVHIRHQEAKNRALRILLSGQATNEAAFDRLNALRRRIERWTDLFLSQLPNSEHASAFAFDPARLKDFGRENHEQTAEQFQMKQRVLAASFSTDLIRGVTANPANPELNREIVSGILACFPADRFDSCGMPKSLRTVWLEKSGDETSMLVDHLINFENQAI